MTLFTGPVFEMAREQFHVIADHPNIPIDERDRLLMPKRAIASPAQSTWTTAAPRCFRDIACNTI